MKSQKACLFLLLTALPFSLVPAGLVRAQTADEDTMLREDLAPYLEKEETARWSLTNPFSEELVQTAEKQVQTIRQTPAAIDVITGEEIQRYGYPNLIDFLASLPGFYSYYPRDYRIAGVRGFCRQGSWNNRILILVDGHSINSDFDGSSFVEEDFGVGLDGVDRIEIVRGPGSSLYGSNALFAVINIITKSGKELDGGLVKAGGASYGTWMAGGAFGKKFANKIDIMASGQFLDSYGRELYYQEYDNPPDSDGRTSNTDSLRNWVAYTKLSYQDLSFKFQAKDRRKDLPQGAYFTTLGDDRNFLRDGSGFAEARWDPQLTPDLSLSSRVYADFVHYNGSYYYKGDEYPLSLEGWDDWYTGAEVKLNWKQSRFFKLLGGGEYQYHWQDFWLRYETDDGEVDTDSDPDWDKTNGTGAVFLHAKIEPWKKLSINVGLRYDHFPGFGGELNPRAGVIYTPYSSGTIKLLYGQAFRAPSQYEYNYTDIYYYLPNDVLEPEKLYTYELVFEQSIKQNLFLSASAYLTDIDNLINQVEIYDPSQIVGTPPEQEVIDWSMSNAAPNEAIFLQFQNYGSIRSYGIDLSLRAKWPNGIEGFLNTTLQKTEETSGGETLNLSNSPAVFGNVGLSFPFPYTRKHFFLSPHFQFSGERDIQGTEDESGNPLTTGAYLLTNLNLVLRDLPKDLQASLGFYNLFDVDYSFPGGGDFVQNRIRADGINFRFLVSYTIR
ncbi:MAG: TonB-dependent receptor [bacterium]|nr:TonB-dependent receptor [bacterium]